MKHIFVLNPVAGHGEALQVFLPKILEAVKESGVDYEIHRTMNVGDGTHFVKNRCLEEKEEHLRFYAVGGDGTLNEVINGAMGFPNVEVAFIPSGTGNDFARGFSDHKRFRDIPSQLSGTAISIDVIRYNDRYAINMMNIGLDCAVVSEVNILKKKPLIKGPLAYMAGVGIVLIENQGFDLTVTLEDGQVHSGEYTLVAIGNGAYCGGGFKGVPRARLDDGLLDVSLISKANRRTVVPLLGLYRKGTHLDSKLAKGIITYVQCRSLHMKPNNEKEMQVCIDGEIEFTTELSIDILPGAIRFSVPKGCQ